MASLGLPDRYVLGLVSMKNLEDVEGRRRKGACKGPGMGGDLVLFEVSLSVRSYAYLMLS